MKNSEIKELSKDELTSKLAEEKENLAKLKFAHAISAIENPSRIAVVRKNIARLSTALTGQNKAQQASSEETK
ncbi:MAG: 50S ribosomal protein L29 [Sphingobacteriales bacterium]|nr:MAG: 50S ribosomal protein L29 [Sphingobacteriales bacterium]